MKFSSALLLLALLKPIASTAEVAASSAEISAQAAIEVARHPVWLKLGHYQPARTASGYRSAVTSPDFFLSEDGRVNPRAELEATLKAFEMSVGLTSDEHAQCVFRGRYVFLSSLTGLLNGGTPKARCEKFNRWALGGTAESISIVFATGYLSNPASFYGHVLMKFNGSDSTRYLSLLDTSVNYGAIVPDNTDPISYIANGVFGGYDGGFSQIQFYFHSHNYADIELRDLWEYRLALSEDEVELMMAHAWELLGRRFTYYFFRENCAYRMAELINLADGVDVFPENRFWTIPQSLVQKLVATERRGRSLVDEVRHHPSLQTRFIDRYSSLDSEGREQIGRLVAEPSLLSSADFASRAVHEKQHVLDALLDYHRFVGNERLSADHPLQIGYRTALATRLALPPSQGVQKTSPRESPDRGRPPGLFRVGSGYNSEVGAIGLVQLRPAYYDALDGDVGQIPSATLTMADLTLVTNHDRLALRRFDAVKVESVRRFASGLPGDESILWRVRVGIDSVELIPNSHKLFRAEAAVGRALPLRQSAIAALYIGGSLQQDRERQGMATGLLGSFLEFRFRPSLATRLEYEYRMPVDGMQDHRQWLNLETRLRLSRHYDLRVRYSDDGGSNEAAAAVGAYW
jgi:hypothetical protein